MQKEQYTLVVIVIAIVTVGLVVNPALSEQICPKNSNFELENKGQQGELKFNVKGGGLSAPNDADIDNRCYAIAS